MSTHLEALRDRLSSGNERATNFEASTKLIMRPESHKQVESSLTSIITGKTCQIMTCLNSSLLVVIDMFTDVKPCKSYSMDMFIDDGPSRSYWALSLTLVSLEESLQIVREMRHATNS